MSEYELLIGGKLVAGDMTMDFINPATEEVLATCPRASSRLLDEAVAAASGAFKAWAKTPSEKKHKFVKNSGNFSLERFRSEWNHSLTRKSL